MSNWINWAGLLCALGLLGAAGAGCLNGGQALIRVPMLLPQAMQEAEHYG